MATEIGSQGLTISGTSIPLVVGEGSDVAAISNFFQGFYDSTIPVANPGTQAGQQVSVTDLGKTLYTFDSGAGDVVKFKGNQSGAVGTGNNDTVKAGGGDNSIIITDNASHTVKLGAGDDFLQVAGTGGNTILAGDGNDSVVGGVGNDTIKGGNGADYLQGGGGADTLVGGNGKDVLVGGVGDDTMTGGNGNDIFVIGNENTGHDIITDFQKGDVLNIQNRNGESPIDTTAPGGGIFHDTGNNTITVFLKGGDTIVLDNIKDKQDLHDNGDGTFTL